MTTEFTPEERTGLIRRNEYKQIIPRHIWQIVAEHFAWWVKLPAPRPMRAADIRKAANPGLLTQADIHTALEALRNAS